MAQPAVSTKLRIKLKGVPRLHSAGLHKGPNSAGARATPQLQDLRAAVEAFSLQGANGLPGGRLLDAWNEEAVQQAQKEVLPPTLRVRKRCAEAPAEDMLLQHGPEFVVWGRHKRQRTQRERLRKPDAKLSSSVRRIFASGPLQPPPAAARPAPPQQQQRQQQQHQRPQQQQWPQQQQPPVIERPPSPQLGGPDFFAMPGQQMLVPPVLQLPEQAVLQQPFAVLPSPLGVVSPGAMPSPALQPLQPGAALLQDPMQAAAAVLHHQHAVPLVVGQFSTAAAAVGVLASPTLPPAPEPAPVPEPAPEPVAAAAAASPPAPVAPVVTAEQQQQQQTAPVAPAAQAPGLQQEAAKQVPVEEEPKQQPAAAAAAGSKAAPEAPPAAQGDQPKTQSQQQPASAGAAQQKQPPKKKQQQQPPEEEEQPEQSEDPSTVERSNSIATRLRRKKAADTQQEAASQPQQQQQPKQQKQGKGKQKQQKQKLEASQDSGPPAKKARTAAQQSAPAADDAAADAGKGSAAAAAAKAPAKAAAAKGAAGKAAAAAKNAGAGKQPAAAKTPAAKATGAKAVAAAPATAKPATGAKAGGAAGKPAAAGGKAAAAGKASGAAPAGAAAAAVRAEQVSPDPAAAAVKPESPPSETSHQQPIAASVPQHLQSPLQGPLVPQLPQEQTALSRDRSQCSLQQQPAESPVAVASAAGTAAAAAAAGGASAAAAAALPEPPGALSAAAAAGGGGAQPSKHLLELEAAAMTPAALALSSVEVSTVAFRSILPDKPFATQEEALAFLDGIQQEARGKKHQGDQRCKQHLGWDVLSLTCYVRSALEFLRYWDGCHKALKVMAEAGKPVELLKRRCQSLVSIGLLKQVSQLINSALANASNCRGQDVQKQALRMLLERLCAICQLRHLHSQRDVLSQQANLLKGAVQAGSGSKAQQQQQQQQQRVVVSGKPPARAVVTATAAAAGSGSSGGSSPRGKQAFNKRSPDDSNTSNQDRVQLPGMLNAEQHSPGLAQHGSSAAGHGSGAGSGAGAAAGQEHALMIAETGCAQHLSDMLKITDGMHQTVMRMQQFLESPEVLADADARGAALHISTLGIDAGMFSIPRVVAHAEAALAAIVRSGRRGIGRA